MKRSETVILLTKAISLSFLLMLISFLMFFTLTSTPGSPPCAYYKEVGTYKGNITNTEALQIALKILKKRDPRIRETHLATIANRNPDYNAGETANSSFPSLNRQSKVLFLRKYNNAHNIIQVNSSRLIIVRVLSSFYNDYRPEKPCVTHQDISREQDCIGDLYFVSDTTYLRFGNPC